MVVFLSTGCTGTVNKSDDVLKQLNQLIDRLEAKFLLLIAAVATEFLRLPLFWCFRLVRVKNSDWVSLDPVDLDLDRR